MASLKAEQMNRILFFAVGYFVGLWYGKENVTPVYAGLT
jgi:hypothetical protein